MDENGNIPTSTKRTWESTVQYIGGNDVSIESPGPSKRSRPSRPDETTASRSVNYNISRDNIISVSSDDDLDNENRMQIDKGIRDATSTSTSTSSASQDAKEYSLAINRICLEGDLYDSCFGVVVFENCQLRDKFFSGKAPKDVSFEVNGTMVIIRDATSNVYGGLLSQSAARVIVNMIKDHHVELSASIKAPNRIEVLIYGYRKENSYDATRSYYNPQCFFHPDKEAEATWKYNELSSPQPTGLAENEKSKVNELLDSAVGPVTFRSVEISDILITKLKDHQRKALSMMTEKEAGYTRNAEFSSVWVESQERNLPFYNTVTQRFAVQAPRLCLGGLLADDMGLGKTLTTLSLIATTLGNKYEDYCGTLIVCPMTTITGWQDQIERHFKKGSLTYKIYHGSARDDDVMALKSADIVITSYETLRSGMPYDDERIESKGSRRPGLLHSIDWLRVVLDEAHVVRNRTSKTFHAVKMLKARHRWCLSGTPIQNSLDDLGSLIEFLRVDPFDDTGVFRNTFLTPIKNGRSDGWERLRSLIKAIALRRTKKALDADLNLPPRHERIHEVHLDNEENTSYDLVKRYFIRSIDSGGSAMNTFQLILRLRQICNHGKDLLPQNVQAWLREVSVFSDAVIPQSYRCEVCDMCLDENEASYCVLACFHQVCRACLRSQDIPGGSSNTICPLCDVNIGGTKQIEANSTVSELGSIGYRPSSKVKALLQNLWIDRQAVTVPGKGPLKSVVFSTWTGMLDLIGKALSVNGFIYERLDGSKNLAQRRSALENFRINPDCTILLASLGSAAVGLDLTMASRVHLMEPGWNPLLEQQAMDRVHRLGQENEVIATRYIVSSPDSIEQYVRRRQEWKMNLIASSLGDSKAHHNEVEGILKDFMRTICA